MKKNKFTSIVFLSIAILCVFGFLDVSAQKTKVSCVGNSITYGYGLSDPANESYPGQLQVLLGVDTWKVENFGSSGRTLLKSGGYSYWDDQRYKDALASSPDFIVIELGTNDSKRWLWDWKGFEFKTDYKALVQSFQSLPSKPEIWIGLLIPGEKADWDIFNSYIKDKVNPKIKEVAVEMGIGLIDLYTALNSNKHEWYLEDSIHPSVAGAGVIATNVKEILLMPKPEIELANGKCIAPEGFEFQWYIDGVPVASNSQGQQREISLTKSGNYKVSVKMNADNETRIISKETYILATNLLIPNTINNEVSIFPNPASEFICVQMDNLKTNNYIITDFGGKVVLSGQLSDVTGKISISALSPGIYFLIIKNKHIKIVKS
jgi:lysophospholipase L1-like esterase